MPRSYFFSPSLPSAHSFLQAPNRLGELYLGAALMQLKVDGYTIYAVDGTWPPRNLDRRPFSSPSLSLLSPLFSPLFSILSLSLLLFPLSYHLSSILT